MNNVIGYWNYLPIILHNVKKVTDLPSIEWHHSSTLLWMGNPQWSEEAFSSFIEMLAKANVLHISVGGENSDFAFDQLFRVLDGLNCEANRITGLIDNEAGREAMEYFLIIGYPTVERFDELREYHIIVVDSAESALIFEASGKEYTQ